MNLLFLWASILSLISLWALWVYGYRPLFVEEFQFRIEGLKYEVLSLAKSEGVPTNDPCIMAEIQTLDGLVQIAGRVGLAHLLLTKRHIENHHAHLLHEHQLMREETLRSLSPFVRNRIEEIDYRAAISIVKFLLLRAPVWIVWQYATYFVLWFKGHKRSAAKPVEKLRKHAYHQAVCVDVNMKLDAITV